MSRVTVDSTANRPGHSPMLFPARRGTRYNEIDRLLLGIVDLDGAVDDEAHQCDGDTGCPAMGHRDGCRAAGDPLRSRGSIRAHRIA